MTHMTSSYSLCGEIPLPMENSAFQMSNLGVAVQSVMWDEKRDQRITSTAASQMHKHVSLYKGWLARLCREDTLMLSLTRYHVFVCVFT